MYIGYTIIGYVVQWNLSNPDTLGTKESVPISEMSLGDNCTQSWHLGQQKVSCLSRCSHFRVSRLEGFHCNLISRYMYIEVQIHCSLPVCALFDGALFLFLSLSPPHPLSSLFAPPLHLLSSSPRRLFHGCYLVSLPPILVSLSYLRLRQILLVRSATRMLMTFLTS